MAFMKSSKTNSRAKPCPKSIHVVYYKPNAAAAAAALQGPLTAAFVSSYLLFPLCLHRDKVCVVVVSFCEKKRPNESIFKPKIHTTHPSQLIIMIIKKMIFIYNTFWNNRFKLWKRVIGSNLYWDGTQYVKYNWRGHEWKEIKERSVEL